MSERDDEVERVVREIHDQLCAGLYAVCDERGCIGLSALREAATDARADLRAAYDRDMSAMALSADRLAARVAELERALADARREGARRMQEKCTEIAAVPYPDGHVYRPDLVAALRALKPEDV